MFQSMYKSMSQSGRQCLNYASFLLHCPPLRAIRPGWFIKGVHIVWGGAYNIDCTGVLSPADRVSPHNQLVPVPLSVLGMIDHPQHCMIVCDPLAYIFVRELSGWIVTSIVP